MVAMDFDDLIRALGGTAKVADACGVTDGAVSLWKRRGSIPPGYWSRLITLAADLGDKTVTLESLVRLHTKDAPAEARA